MGQKRPCKSMRDGEVADHQELAMIEIKKEEKEREVEEEGIDETEKDDEEEEEEEDERIDERLVEMKLSKEKEEDSLNNNNSEEKDELVLKLKSENLEEEEEEEEEEEGMKGFQLKGMQGMSPVETATLLLLSRIALFNKVTQSEVLLEGIQFQK